MMRRLVILSVLLGGAATVSAQDIPRKSVSGQRFSEVLIVSATLEEAPASRLPVSIDVIERQEIEARQTNSVADLLRTIPGLTIIRSGSAGKVTSLFSRGTESDHTLALWNGIELNNPFFGGFDWAFLPTDGVERVEIVRGPFSAVHGSDALGGVVQVLTGNRTGGKARFEAGENNYSRLGVDAGFSGSNYQIDLAASTRRGDGEAVNDFFDSEDVALSARWNATDTLVVSLVGRAHESDNGIPFTGATPSPNRTISWRERQLAVPLSWRRNSWEVDARLSRVSYSTAFRDPDDLFGFTAYDTDSLSQRLRLSASYRVSDSSWIAFGAEDERLEVDDRSIFGINLDKARQRTSSSFAQTSWAIGRMQLDLGMRHDDNNVFGSRSTPKVGLVLEAGERGSVRASWGGGFRAPSIGELFYPYSGSDELEPEESESWELGYEYQGVSWSAGATLFDNRIENLIDFDFVTYTNRNVGRAASRGVELWSRHVGRQVTVSGNLTLLDTEDLETGLSLLRRPAESASLVMTSSPGDWNWSVSAQYVGERADVDAVSFGRISLGSHTRLDTAVRYERWERLQPYARVENLADRAYEEAAGYPAVGRRVIGGLATAWK